MPTIVVTPQASRRMTNEDLEPLVEELRLLGFSVEIRHERRSDHDGLVGGGPEWWEFVYVHLPDVAIGLGTTVITKVAESAVSWARKRFTKSNSRVGKIALIYGPDGKEVARVELKGRDAEPKIILSEEEVARAERERRLRK